MLGMNYGAQMHDAAEAWGTLKNEKFRNLLYWDSTVELLCTKLRGFSPQANSTDQRDRRMSAKLVPTFCG
jgi:hypothetical protein